MECCKVALLIHPSLTTTTALFRFAQRLYHSTTLLLDSTLLCHSTPFYSAPLGKEGRRTSYTHVHHIIVAPCHVMGWRKAWKVHGRLQLPCPRA